MSQRIADFTWSINCDSCQTVAPDLRSVTVVQWRKIETGKEGKRSDLSGRKDWDRGVRGRNRRVRARDSGQRKRGQTEEMDTDSCHWLMFPGRRLAAANFPSAGTPVTAMGQRDGRTGGSGQRLSSRTTRHPPAIIVTITSFLVQ